MKYSTILSTLACAKSVHSISVLLPLYTYPLPGKWQPVYDAIASDKNVQYYVIVNPDSGPGGADGPGSEYLDAVATLNGNPNVHTLGYVHTNYAAESYDTLTNNITSYASWTGTSALDGIFYDEAPYDTSTTSSDYMSNAVKLARGAFKNGPSTHIFNPGTIAPANYFNFADYILDAEDAWADYNPSQTPLKLQPPEKSAIVIHDVPAGADLVGAVQKAKDAGIAMMYFTSDCCYQEFGMVGDVAKAFSQVGGAAPLPAGGEVPPVQSGGAVPSQASDVFPEETATTAPAVTAAATSTGHSRHWRHRSGSGSGD